MKSSRKSHTKSVNLYALAAGPRLQLEPVSDQV